MAERESEYRILLNIVILAHEKHKKIAWLIRLIREKSEKAPGEFSERKKEIAGLCDEVKKNAQEEQNLDRQAKRAQKKEIKQMEFFEIHASKMMGVIRGKNSGGPEADDLVGWLDRVHELEREEKAILKGVLTVFYLLFKIITSNVSQKKIFEEENYERFLADAHKILPNLLLEELEALDSIIKIFAKLHDEIEKKHLNTLQIYEKYSEWKKRSEELQRLAKKTLVKAVERDEETMSNNKKELPFLEKAEQAGIQVLDESKNIGNLLFEQLGQEYAVVTGSDDYDVYWNTIPIVHNTLLSLIEFVGVMWRKLYLKYFPDKVFAKPLISGLTRTLQSQKKLQEHSKYATAPDKSAHVRGLAVDFATRQISVNILKSNGSKGDVREAVDNEIQPRVVALLEQIVRPLHETKVNGLSICNGFIESNGCFHISVNPDPDAIAVLRGKAQDLAKVA